MTIDELQPIFRKNKAFTVQEVAQALSISNKEASVLLSRYARQGNVRRIKPGTYLPVGERFLNPEESLSNPWLVVPSLFPNSYVGGWSAASHWGLTDQLFETTCVLTLKKIYHSHRAFGRFSYRLFKIKDFQNFGIEMIWQEQTQVPLSDPHKTIIDMIINPKCGGGIQHTIDCFKTYISEFKEDTTLHTYAEKIQNGVFFKRLGFLSEKLLSPTHPLCLLSLNKMSKGYVPIDPALSCTRLMTKWNLFVPEDMTI